MRFLIPVLVLLIYPISAGAVVDSERFCEAQLRLALPFDGKVASVSDLFFVSRQPASLGDFQFTNKSRQGVTALFLAVELRDHSGRYSFTGLSFYATSWDRPVANEFKPYAPQDIAFLRLPIAPGEQRALEFRVPSVTTVCPRSARVTAAEIRYADGSRLHFLADDVRRDAEAKSVSLENIAGAGFKLPVHILADIVVQANGQSQVDDVLEGPVGSRDWLNGPAWRWEFIPARIGGVPEATRLRVLFRFHENSMGYPQLPFRPRMPLQVVDVFPAPDSVGGWMVVWCGDPVGSP